MKSTHNDDGDITTTGTQVGDDFDQMQELLREKDQVIEGLAKEKTYYLRKLEQLGKSGGQARQTEELALKVEQAKQTIASQKELIGRQTAYLAEMEERV